MQRLDCFVLGDQMANESVSSEPSGALEIPLSPDPMPDSRLKYEGQRHDKKQLSAGNIDLCRTQLTDCPTLSVTAEEDAEFKRQFTCSDDTSSPKLRSTNDDETRLSCDESGSEKRESEEHVSDRVTADGSEAKKSPLQLTGNNKSQQMPALERSDELEEQAQIIELRFLVRRREAGALIGKRGTNIKRLRELFRSSVFSIPDTGNGPERVVCIATNEKSMDAILRDLTQLLMEKSPENDEQIELKLLIHSSHAGSIIGIGGQSIKKLRNDSRAAIKIYEQCCPLSNERVCAIKAKPPVVVSTIKLIQTILNENPIKGTIKPYDALHFDLNLIDKYGGYLPDETLESLSASHYVGGHIHQHHYEPALVAFNRRPAPHGEANYRGKHFSLWRQSDFGDPCELHSGRQTSSTPELCQLQERQNTNASQQLDIGNKTNGNGKTCAAGIGAECGGDKSPGSSSGQTTLLSGGSGSGSVGSAHYQGPTRSGRFHPYASLVAPATVPLQGAQFQQSHGRMPTLYHHQLPLAHHTYQRLMPGGYTLAGIHQIDQRQQHASCNIRAPTFTTSLPERCRHARPCLCMYLPVIPPEVVPGTTAPPFVQVAAKNFNYSRNFIHGYKKK